MYASFVSGKSVSTAPEISLALLLGQATSAPAGPLTGYISTLLATLPRGTIMSTLLARLNDFVMHRRWEKRWGNPIRGADEPNPLYGIGDGGTWEPKGRIKLMDGGLSNNLPNREPRFHCCPVLAITLANGSLHARHLHHCSQAGRCHCLL